MDNFKRLPTTWKLLLIVASFIVGIFSFSFAMMYSTPAQGRAMICGDGSIMCNPDLGPACLIVVGSALDRDWAKALLNREVTLEEYLEGMRYSFDVPESWTDEFTKQFRLRCVPGQEARS